LLYTTVEPSAVKPPLARVFRGGDFHDQIQYGHVLRGDLEVVRYHLQGGYQARSYKTGDTFEIEAGVPHLYCFTELFAEPAILLLEWWPVKFQDMKTMFWKTFLGIKTGEIDWHEFVDTYAPYR